MPLRTNRKKTMIREKRKGRKNAKSFNCVLLYSRLLRSSRTNNIFISVYLRSSVDKIITRIALQV